MSKCLIVFANRSSPKSEQEVQWYVKLKLSAFINRLSEDLY